MHFPNQITQLVFDFTAKMRIAPNTVIVPSDYDVESEEVGGLRVIVSDNVSSPEVAVLFDPVN